MTKKTLDLLAIAIHSGTIMRTPQQLGAKMVVYPKNK